MAVLTGDKIILKACAIAFTKIADGAKIGNVASVDYSQEYATDSKVCLGDTVETFTRTIRKNSFSLNLKFNPTDLGQKIIFDNYKGKSTSFFLLIQENKTIDDADYYEVFVSKISKKVSPDKAIECSIELALVNPGVNLVIP